MGRACDRCGETPTIVSYGNDDDGWEYLCEACYRKVHPKVEIPSNCPDCGSELKKLKILGEYYMPNFIEVSCIKCDWGMFVSDDDVKNKEAIQDVKIDWDR